MRTQVQHACVEAAFTNTLARRMPACMPPNDLAALGPQGRTNAFLGHGHFIVKREVLQAN